MIECVTGVEPCQAGEFQCKNDKTCIAIALRCDGKVDCGDRTDESGCRKYFQSRPAAGALGNGTRRPVSFSRPNMIRIVAGLFDSAARPASLSVPNSISNHDRYILFLGRPSSGSLTAPYFFDSIGIHSHFCRHLSLLLFFSFQSVFHGPVAVRLWLLHRPPLALRRQSRLHHRFFRRGQLP